MGLWIIQCCKKQWDREENISWDDIIVLANSAPAFRSFIDVNDTLFFDGDDMTEKIQQYCRQKRQPVPESKGEIARTVYESLAMSYREALPGLEKLKGRRIDVLHIVGGGSKKQTAQPVRGKRSWQRGNSGACRGDGDRKPHGSGHGVGRGC